MILIKGSEGMLSYFDCIICSCVSPAPKGMILSTFMILTFNLKLSSFA